MRWSETGVPVRMQRVALVAATARWRATLVAVAESGSVQLEAAERAAADRGNPARELLRGLPTEGTGTPRLARQEPDLDELARTGRADLLAGEAELDDLTAAATRSGEVVALAGWMPADAVAPLAGTLSPLGSAVCPLEPPRGADPPTLLHAGGTVRRSVAPLIGTYATVPYPDLDPTLAAGVAYVVMFGMMFGDAGHGLLLVLAGLLLWRGVFGTAGLRRMWPFVTAAGCAATFFGLLYGDFFGPTGVVPVLWLRPLDHPVTLLATAIGLGAVLLSAAYVVGTVNRWREGGWPLALLSTSGIGGAAVFAGAGMLLLGVAIAENWVVVAGVVLVAGGLVLSWLGFLAAAGSGGGAAVQATVQLVDSVVRLGANVVSFARLAAFGLTHGAIGLIVWQLTTYLWHRGGFFTLLAVVAFLTGNAVAFALEALIAGVQALRLSYYELFSRVFASEGSPFVPWRPPVEDLPVGDLVEVGGGSG